MKTYIPYSLILAAASVGMAFGAETAYTSPVGYNTSTLSQGFNALGLTLQTPSLASGNFETITSTTVTDAGVTYAPISGQTYILEIKTGSLAGAIFEVPASGISGSTITIATVPVTDLLALGLTSADTYTLRIAPTLETIFTLTGLAGGGVLTAALSSGTADIVWVPNGSGGYVQYYLRSGASPEFRNVATNTAAPNVPLIYSDGFFVQKKGTTPAALTVSGEVKKGATTSIAVQGFNLVGSVAPAGLNLFNAGLETSLTAALSVGTADVVWVQNASLTYTQYFRRSGSGAGWRVSGSAVTLTQSEAEAVSLSYGFLIQRKAASPINLKVNVPASYLNL
jgi:hypothetical protein